MDLDRVKAGQTTTTVDTASTVRRLTAKWIQPRFRTRQKAQGRAVAADTFWGGELFRSPEEQGFGQVREAWSGVFEAPASGKQHLIAATEESPPPRR